MILDSYLKSYLKSNLLNMSLSSPSPHPSNKLYSRIQCPECELVFIGGFDPTGQRECPSCHLKFVDNSDHNKRSSCQSNGADNLYFKDHCPAIMSDSRFITYYNSSKELTEAVRKANGNLTPNQFREFMQRHGNEFINAERKYLHMENTCRPKIACSQGWLDLLNRKWTS